MPARKGAKRGRAAAAAAVAEVTEPSAVTEEATTEGEEHTAAPSAELQPVALLLTTLLSGEDPVGARARVNPNPPPPSAGGSRSTLPCPPCYPAIDPYPLSEIAHAHAPNRIAREGRSELADGMLRAARVFRASCPPPSARCGSSLWRSCWPRSCR
jgi:hypothetical protein